MQWSFSIGTVAGSQIRIHLTFFLLLAWIGLVALQTGGTAAAVEGIAFIIAIFACVVLHELGHAIAARRYGIVTPRITLLPIGGVAQLERMPEKPGQEIVVALAGPAVNVVIATVLIFILGANVDLSTAAAIEDPTVSFVARVAAVNVILVLFNLIPAFPMDGGRVLRALLATRYSRVRATQIAARIGQFLAIIFGFLGLLGGNPLLIFVAIFVYIAATAESQMTGMQDIARSLGVRDGMITQYEALGPGARLGQAADLLLMTTQREFPVLANDGTMAGVLGTRDLIAGLDEAGRDGPVSAYMNRDVPVMTEDETLYAAMVQLQQHRKPAVAVMGRDGALAGYVTAENLSELMMVEDALAGRR
ncbi:MULTISPECIES: site-2 protease family protein [unclassified Roseitalea]|uniref:site-2 protease family protein n=1 Tax=unclassified Roseitalea TaxID=2639107 RepID=UPI00273D6C3F|nr:MULTISPECIES: site-2 protease family protein [unclassified Roseitalea]